MITRAIFFSLLVIYSLPSIASTSASASSKIESCESEDCQYLYKKYKSAADRGHIEAMATLGQFYQVGFGTDKDINKAMYYFKKASKGGSVSGSYKAGLLYFSEPSFKDLDKGQMYLEKASSEGFKNSQFLLGIAYLSEDFGMHNIEKADKYLADAYEDMHPDLPIVVSMITERYGISDSNFPELYEAMQASPLVTDNEGNINWPKDETEVITITSSPVKIVLAENLVFFRQHSTSLGSRLPSATCTNRPGCYTTPKMEGLLYDFPFLRIVYN